MGKGEALKKDIKKTRKFGKKAAQALKEALPPPPAPLADLSAEYQLATGALILGALWCLWFSFLRKPTSNTDRDPRKISEAGFWRLASAAAFTANVLVVSLPGRFDGAEGAATNDFPWGNLFAPAPWAYAIWGAIYLGELAGVVAPLLYGGEGEEADQAQAARGPGWVAANVAQCLWCACFRPWALGLLWLPASLLAVTALCLAASQSGAPLPSVDKRRLLTTLPRSLHLGWASAAFLLLRTL